MDSFVEEQDIAAFTYQPCSGQMFHHERKRSDVTVASTVRSLPTEVNTATTTTSASTYSSSSTTALFHPNPKQQPFRPAMSVYYQDGHNGPLQATSTQAPHSHGGSVYPDVNYYLQRGDTVGAYLAQRALTSSGYNAGGASHPVSHSGESMYHKQPNFHKPRQASNARHQAGWLDESFEAQIERYSAQPSTVGNNSPASHSSQPRRYPDPEDVRHQYTLYGLLSNVDPARRFRALEGPALDIVENETNFVFAHDLPKKMLVLYLGRHKVSEYIRTLGPRRGQQFENCRGRQILVIPHGVSSVPAFRILAAWMSRASQRYCVNSMRQFIVPQNTYAACTLAQTLTLFGLHKDALRVDEYIAKEHFRRPIFAVELETMWNSLGGGNRYTYAMIKIIADRLRVYEIGASKKFPMLEEMLQLLERYPRLKARVRDPDFNEKCKPIFGGEWCRSMGIPPREDHTDEFPRRATNGVATVQEDRSGGASKQTAEPEPSEKPKVRTRMAAVLRIVPASEKKLKADEMPDRMAEK